MAKRTELKNSRTNLALTKTATTLLAQIAEDEGNSRSAVMERLIREEAKRLGISAKAVSPYQHIRDAQEVAKEGESE